MFEPPITEAEARSEGFELEDYETDEVEVWPENEPAFQIFRRVGSRWRYPAMGGVPIGLDWQAVYPLMDRILSGDDWVEVQDALSVMEDAALATMREFAPKGKE